MGCSKSTVGLDCALESISQIMFLKNLFETGFYNPGMNRIYTVYNIPEAHRYINTG